MLSRIRSEGSRYTADWFRRLLLDLGTLGHLHACRRYDFGNAYHTPSDALGKTIRLCSVGKLVCRARCVCGMDTKINSMLAVLTKYSIFSCYHCSSKSSFWIPRRTQVLAWLFHRSSLQSEVWSLVSSCLVMEDSYHLSALVRHS